MSTLTTSRRLRRGGFVTIALTLAVLVAGCAASPRSAPPTATSLTPTVVARTTPVAATDRRATVTYSGNVVSRNRITLLPKTAGQIVALDIDVGSHVQHGDVIAQLDHAALDAQVAQAQAGLEVAQAKLATLQAGSRPETIAQAQANLAAAQAALAFLQNGGRPEMVQAAEGNLVTAAGQLNRLEQARPEAVAQAQAGLAASEAALQALQLGPTTAQIAVAQQAVEAAKDTAYAADVNKDGACNPVNPRYLCNAAEAQADAAHTAINQAQAQLTVLTSPPTAQQLQQAQAAVDQARAQLQLAQHPGSAGDVAAAQGAVMAARAQLALAKQPASSADLAKAQAAVDVAAQQLALAREPYTVQDLNAATAAVAQARAVLGAAQVARDEATVKAPIDGVVSEKLLSLGALAAPTTPIVTLVDPRVEVVVDVAGAEASSLHRGDPATITADALTGTSIPGNVTTIAPATDPRTRTVAVKVTPDSTDSGLTDGMLAQVQLTVDRPDPVQR
jgi:HlyD family secretion protein